MWDDSTTEPLHLKNDDPVFKIMETPENKWEWDMFGNRELLIRTPRDYSWFFRLKARWILGSRFERIGEAKGE